jgi:hypothetical protein
MSRIIAGSLVIALGIILLLHYIYFWIFGGVWIYEANRVGLVLETIMAVAILWFGFRYITDYVKEKKRNESRKVN